jgi:transposase
MRNKIKSRMHLGAATMSAIAPTWLADVLARIAEHPVQRLDELPPWNWRGARRQVDHAA